MAVLSGKAAVVTGGSRGIGRAVVERLARDGAQVVFGYATNAEAAADVEHAVAAAGGKAHGVPADLAVPGGVAALFAESDKHLDGLDILVNNAAPAIVPAELGEMTDEQFDLMAARMTPLRRLGEPADIADVIAFLAGPDGRWMTGQNLLATGGLRI